jgi:hypothetical protein
VLHPEPIHLAGELVAELVEEILPKQTRDAATTI